MKVSSTKSKKEIVKCLARCRRDLAHRFKISRMALFGSYARGDQTETSDVDVLVEVDPSIGLDFVSLANTIERKVGLPTDVVSSRALKPRHFKAIESEIIYV